ncbi:hypothetical protein G8759_24680 [Spirosoma aureum]|uniref:Uncharacterized protein n=3 Tax=Spirosoma TaxID=107 RepID=A0A6G9AT87_9BACT|nr:hypothetical protein [Spirosoma aureum]QHV99158.1 hypothetical protein GJR95_30960 [Spirosoma endbachense]QIP15598.1 hypothetical protein G8759_24680 [Spirosoma aureum]
MAGYQNTVVRTYVNAPAYFGGSSFTFQDSITWFGSRLIRTAFICSVQGEQIQHMNLTNSIVIDPVTLKARLVDSTNMYPYRVWGTIYRVPIYAFDGAPVHAVRIDKIEKAN